MLETEIKKLTAAIEANTVALTGSTPAAPAPAAPAPVIETSTGAPAAPAAPDATYEQVTQAIMAVAKQVNREAATKLLADYSAVRVPDLKKDPSKYGEIAAKAAALLPS
jgi:hypothetical protein